jgi:hypothetical protein
VVEPEAITEASAAVPAALPVEAEVDVVPVAAEVVLARPTISVRSI